MPLSAPEYLPVTDNPKIGVITVGTVTVNLTSFPAGLVFLHAPATNTAVITLGVATPVTAAVGATLSPGDWSPPLCLNNLGQLYAISTSASQSLEYVVQA